jgi:hypothetical protein
MSNVSSTEVVRDLKKLIRGCMVVLTVFFLVGVFQKELDICSWSTFGLILSWLANRALRNKSNELKNN